MKNKYVEDIDSILGLGLTTDASLKSEVDINEHLHVEGITEEIDDDDIDDDAAAAMMLYDQNRLLKYIAKRIGIFVMDDMIESLRDSDETFWYRAFIQVIKIYSLNTLKTDISSVTDLDLRQNTIDILKDIKIRLIQDIMDDKFTKDISRDDFEKYLIRNNYSKKLIWVIKYIDGGSYKNFIKRLFYEFHSPIYDESDDF